MSLTYGTLRHHLYRRLHLPARVGAQVEIVSQQAVDLLGGRPVTFTREQLASFFPLGQEQHPSLPATYMAESYTLTGDDTLTPRPVTTMLGALACAGALGLLLGLALGLVLARRARSARHRIGRPVEKFAPDPPDWSHLRSGAMPEEWWDWNGHNVTRDGLPPGGAARIADEILADRGA